MFDAFMVHEAWYYQEYNEIFEKKVWYLIDGRVDKGRGRDRRTQQMVANTWGWKIGIGKPQWMR